MLCPAGRAGQLLIKGKAPKIKKKKRRKSNKVRVPDEHINLALHSINLYHVQLDSIKNP